MTQPPGERVATLADSLDRRYYRRLADTDHDGLPDLLVAYDGGWDRPQDEVLARLLLFRGADLAAMRVRAHPLERSRLFPKLEQLVDVTGDGRPEVVLKTRATGSGGVSDWLVYQWTGSGYALVFSHALDHWRGENRIGFAPGEITFTCRPLGTYEHKFDPHRIHEEVWVLRGGRYQFGVHYVPPPATVRQAVIDAESRFRRQDYTVALNLYRKALQLPPEPDVPHMRWQDREWRPYVHLRIGQSLALLGRSHAAMKALDVAVSAGGYVGQAAAKIDLVWAGFCSPDRVERPRDRTGLAEWRSDGGPAAPRQSQV